MATKVKATQSTPASTTVSTLVATYGLKGKGKGRTFYAILPADQGTPGDKVELHTKYGGINYGTLRTIDQVVVVDGVNLAWWSFDQIRATAEQYAFNRAKKAEASAEYFNSDKGRETAEKVLARINGAQATTATTETATTTEEVSTPPVSTPLSATLSPAGIAAAMREAGFTAAEVMEALKGGAGQQAPQSTPVPTPVQPVAPVTTGKVITSTTKPRPTPVPRPTTATTATTTTTSTGTGNGAKRVPCISCGKSVDRLFHHASASTTAGAEINVCNPCMSLDADTVVMKVRRNVAKVTATK